MPGLSQLKQFSSDLLALGDEVSIRASRGEQPLKVEIPSSVEDVNDSEEFVLGMPEVEAEIEEEFIDDDLSDLAGIASSTSGDSSDEGDAPITSFEAPDMADLLEPVSGGDFDGDVMPDLSMFSDEPENIEDEYVEEEPEEVSIADMGLEDLLSGGGFDEPEQSEASDNSDADFSIEPSDDSSVSSSNNENNDFGIDDFNSFDDKSDFNSIENHESLQKSGLINDLGDFDDAEELDDIEDIEDVDEVSEVKDKDDIGDIGNIGDLGNLDDFNIPADDNSSHETGEMPDFTEPIPDITSEEISAEESVDSNSGLDFESKVGEEFETPISDFDLPVEDFENPNLGDISEDLPLEEPEGGVESDFESDNLDNLENLDSHEKASDDFALSTDDSFDLPDMDMDFSSNVPSEESGNEDSNAGVEDFASGVPEGLFDVSDLDSVGDIQGLDNNSDNQIDSLVDIESIESIDFDQENSELKSDENPEPLEIFDTSEMEGIDFDDIPDTDTQISQGVDDDSKYDLKSDDDFAFGSEFEIPGYSDVETVKEQKSGKIGGKESSKEKKHKQKKIHNSGENVAEEENEDELPPNTLSDRQYKIFKQNLSEYPLNVRLAFEDFLVQDEFTDDAEFEVIEKILNKAPARQVASTLEKMLDISIPVPRDFEHRSAEEYEEYKKSISYQLKNKIIPAALIFIVGVFVCIGLFNFGKNCVYRPIRANSLYKQGYVLLQESEYPLSEIKFNKATNYRLSKKWFFKYARGYREHKQYQRAAKMYENILVCFKHDKKAGLEYADMELDDLANYERAEEIVRREVLDYHINDADGILKLGDVFLEWGTEKDHSKLEQAREQYATLLQLYGQKDLYLSRMMRYFIRDDNLREVLQLKQHFEPEEDSLCSDDWTELSGYLLDKYYGELAPSEEYLRYEIEGLRGLLLRAVQSNPENPIALYNLSKYFINTNENEYIESTLQTSIEKFNAAKKMKKRDIYKYIDAYRLLGEHYIETEDFLQSQEQFAEGISLYVTERDHAGFEGTPQIGKLYEDMGNLKYTVSGDYDEALMNYSNSVNLGNDSPKIRYRIGYIQYHNKKYAEALGSFMRAGDGNIKERNLLLAMANTLSLRGDDYAAEGYYNQLIETLDSEIAERGLVLPQSSIKDYDVVNTYLSAANNYGVTLYRLAKKTGDSGKNAEAIVQFSQSLRAWDALTRNQETMVRLPGSNLAEQNIKYITHPIPDFEPAIYTNISKTLLDNEKL